MFDVFSTRETATGFYLLLILLWVLYRKNTRTSFLNLVKAACTKKLIMPFAVLIVYGCLLIYLFSTTPVWNKMYIKDITMWILFVGIPLSFRAVSKGTEEHYFGDIFADNLKLTAIVEFFIGTFTFSIWVELVIQPLILFFLLLQAVAESKEEFNAVKKLMDWIIGIIGLAVIVFTVRAACGMYQEINSTDMIIAFCIPIAFSGLYIPIAYLFALYAKYEIAFIRMSFKEPKDRRIRIKHRMAVIKTCRLSLKRVYLFEKKYIPAMYTTMKPESFDDLMSDFKATCKAKTSSRCDIWNR